ncbi:ATPase, T2SS/T4P/T4SS family [Faecalispora jeddahensis]|uniref:ATPase, T2SS/T4P/T4SS family n=1 Tax=Faecalispora jeddahensis TaxID=1414721 RepID=UPI0028B248B2|nr:ATPase, T2SS/T4P/T4SS family [Faecalispora jeddahensis]
MKSIEFPRLLEDVQGYMAEKYSALLKTPKNNKQQLLSYIKQYIQEKDRSTEETEIDSLASRLYQEMAEYSFLTPYLNGTNDDWEEININRWDDTKITFSDGSIKVSPQQFFSPTHANDIITKLLRESGTILNPSKPLVRGHLNNKIRITVIGTGVIDKDAGISVSIRYINPKKLGKQDFISGGMATEEMLDLLSALYQFGISMSLAGATGTGKTTVMSWLLSTMPYDSRIFTIENTTREFDLVVRDKDGVVLNNVIHTVTKDSDDPNLRITEQMLLEQALTFDPDHICLAEMKGSEAYETQEAARTGHSVICTVHAKSCAKIYDRILDLCSLKGNLSASILSAFIVDAFPICFYIRKGKDHVRRITEICECELTGDGKRNLRTLYRWHTVKNRINKESGKTIVEGYFEKVSTLSETLQQELRDNGMPEDLLKKFLKKEVEVAV